MINKKGSNPITVKKGNSQAQLSFARRSLIPATNAASTIMDYNNISSIDLDWVDLVESLSEQCDLVAEGDLVQAKAMLTAQAHTLDIVYEGRRDS